MEEKPPAKAKTEEPKKPTCRNHPDRLAHRLITSWGGLCRECYEAGLVHHNWTGKKESGGKANR